MLFKIMYAVLALIGIGVFSLFFINVDAAKSGGAINKDNIIKAVYADDIHLRTTAMRITNRCGDDKDCAAYTLYKFVSENIKQMPYNGSVLPPDTILKAGSGNIYEATVLLVSLMENLNIPAYLAVADKKSYLYACGISAEGIYGLLRDELKTAPLLKERVRMAAGQIWMATPKLTDGGGNVMAEVSASAPVDVYILNKTDGGYSEECVETDVFTGALSCYMGDGYSVGIFAAGGDVVADIVLYPHIPAQDIVSRDIDGKKCVPFDLTVDKGWFLYDSESLGAKIVSRSY